MSTDETCESCGLVGEGAASWGGYCHDCDNQLCLDCGTTDCDCEL